MEFVEVEHINSAIDQFIQKKYIHFGNLMYIYQINFYGKKKTRVIQSCDGLISVYSIEVILLNKEIYDVRLVQEVQIYLSNALCIRLTKFQLLLKTTSGNIILQSISPDEMEILIEQLMLCARSITINSTLVTLNQQMFYSPSLPSGEGSQNS